MFQDFEVRNWCVLLWKCGFIFLGILFREIEARCPGACFCPSVTQNVYCSRKNLPFIPNGIPTDTVQLNLNDNNFQNPVLMRSNFTYYTRLEHLYLSGCGIQFISLDTFSDLPKLKWLDISKNRLKVIDDFTFRGLTLQHLFLNDNPGMQISSNAFGGLRTMGLYIHNCAISNITIDVIKPLNGTLKSLWLDGNKIETFSIEWLYVFRALSHIRLGDNPLHCNCEVKWMFQFYRSRQTSFSGVEAPACRTPSALRGKSFSTLTESDFSCQLPIFKNVDLIFEESIGKLTCLASGDPVPVIYWIRPDNSSQKYYPKNNNKDDINSSVKDNQGVMYISNPQAVHNVRYQCIASNPAGNVTLSLNVIWPPSYPRDVGIPDPPKKKEKVTKARPQRPVISTTTSVPDKLFTKYKQESEKKLDTDDDDELYVINASSAGMSMERKETVHDSGFTVVDIVGAVLGTFILTLIACVVIFHFFYRHHEKIFREKSPNTINEKNAHVNNLAPAEKLLLQNNQV